MAETAWNSPTAPVAGAVGSAAGWGVPIQDRTQHLKERTDRLVALSGGANGVAGDLVVPVTSGPGLATRTTAQGQAGPIGVLLAAASVSGAAVYSRWGGIALVNVTGAVANGAWLRPSATAGQAEATTNRAEAFALTRASTAGAGLVEALLLPANDVLTGWARRSAAVASAATITPNATDTVIPITGTTTITGITAQAAGRYLELEFASAGCQVTAGATLLLTTNYVSTAGGVLALRSDGTAWHEVGRSGPLVTIPLFGNIGDQGVAASTTGYTGPNYQNWTFVESVASGVLPVAGTVRNLRLVTRTAQPASGALVVTLRKNTADTAITFTIAANAVAGTYSDLTHSVSFAVGDTLGLKLVNAATATSAVLDGWSLALDLV